ncbi:MAG: GNAT family N-acetyltransferase, partial [Alphaproteobacteria bacterium]
MEAIEEAILETERLRLRAPAPSDAARVNEFIGDWDVVKMLATVPYPYSLEDAHTWLGSHATRTASGE